MKKLFTSLTIFIIELASCYQFGSYNPSIDPGRIWWPKDTWFNNPIELSQTNAGSSITLTINFRPSTTISSGTVQIVFPASFTTETSRIATLPSTYNLQADQDISATYSTILPSSEGIYGSFGIITRYSTGGQIIDANYNYGFIVVTSPAIKGNLSVTRIANSTTKINTDNALEFQFALSFSLWAHDIIEIVPDSNWTPKSGVTCKSVSDPNLIFAADNTNNLPCALGVKSSSSLGVAAGPDSSDFTKDSVYIYGIAQDVYVSAGSNSNQYTVKLDVSYFKAPGFTTSSTSWTINIWRWGINNLLAKYTTTTGPSLTGGVATFTSWKSYNFPSNKAMQSQVLFTQVTVDTETTLPAESTLTVGFSNVDIYNTNWWSDLDGSTNKANGLCYITSSINGASCTTTPSNSATITFTNEQNKGSISFVVLSKIGEAPTVSRISTYYGSTNNIVDQSIANPGSFGVTSSSSSNYKIPDVALHALSPSTTTYPQLVADSDFSLIDSNNMNQGGVKGQDIFIRVTPGGTNAWGGTNGVAATLNFYFNRASWIDFDTFNCVYIDSDATVNDYINTATSLESSNVGNRVLSPANPATAPKSPSSNQISVSFASSSSSPAVSNGSYYILRYSGPGKASLPFIASNKSTFYEIWAIVTYGSTNEIGSSVFSVLPQQTSSKLYTKLLCNDQLDGIPIVNHFEPINTDFSFSTHQYAIDIEIDVGYSYDKGFMGTGIMAYNPGILTINTHFVSSASSATASFTVSNSKLIITIKDLGDTYISAPTKVNTYLPSAIATLGETYLGVNTYFYYLKSSDPSTKQILYQSITNWSVQTTLKSFESSSTGVEITDSSNWDIETSKGITISNKLKSSTPIDSNYMIGIGISQGFTFSSVPSYSVKIDSAAAVASPTSTTYYLSSPSDNCGGFIMAYGSSWGVADPASAGMAYNLAVSNLKSPSHSTSAVPSTWNVWVASTSPGNSCIYSQSYSDQINIPASVLNTPRCYSDSNIIIGASADSVNLSLNFEFTTKVKVPYNGYIVFTLDDSWSWPSSWSSYHSYSISASYSINSNTLKAHLYSDLQIGTYTIVVNGVRPPYNTESYSIEKDCFTSLSTQTNAGNQIESWDSPNTSPLQTKITSSASVKAGNCYLTTNIYPNHRDVPTDMSFDFYCDKALPAESYVMISLPSDISWSYPTSSINIQDYCWTNFIYSSCIITSSSTINIAIAKTIISGTTINIYLDGSIIFPHHGWYEGFLISVYWKSESEEIQIIDNSVEAGKKPVFNTLPLKRLSVTSDVKTAGELSSYTFSLQTAGRGPNGEWEIFVNNGDHLVIQFPKYFDPYIGNSYWNTTSNSWHLECNSTTYGNPTCTANHWYLSVLITGITVPVNNLYNFTVSGVRNSGFFADSYLNIWHFNASYSIKTYPYSQASITLTSPANSINIKSVSTTSNAKNALATYSFDFYPAVTSTINLNSANTLNIVFPQQFSNWSNQSIPCSALIFDETSSSSPNGTSWISSSDCLANLNTVTLKLSSSNSIQVKTTDRIRLSLTGITNPGSGLKRSSDWDVIYGPNYSYWSEKFNIYLANSGVIARTYGNINSAYLGFDQIINTTDTSDLVDPECQVMTYQNYIKLVPGQQSDDIIMNLPSKCSGLRSQKLILTPNNNPRNLDAVANIRFTSNYHNFTLFQLDSEIKFRVLALTGTPPGKYYFDWILDETRQEGVDSSIYTPPASLTIEVAYPPSAGSIKITVDTLPTLYAGYTSIPISVKLASAPASQLIITPLLDEAYGLSINPTSLFFTPDTDVRYFEITLANQSPMNQSPKLSFSLSGADSATFAVPSTLSLLVSNLPSLTTYFQLSAGTPTGTSVTITANFYDNAVIYWGLTCYGAPVLSFDDLKSRTQSLINPSTNVASLSEQLAADYQATETHIDYNKDIDIIYFFKRKHRDHCSTLWTNAVINRSQNGQATITLDWLMDGTHYTFFAYADNKISNSSAFKLVSFTTSALQSIYSMSVTFEGDLPESNSDSIRRVLAKNMGVNPYWLIFQRKTNPSSGTTRLLQSSSTIYTKYTYLVLYDRKKPNYSSSFLISLLSPTRATADLKDAIWTAPLSFGTPAALPTLAIPSFIGEPINTSITDTSAAFSIISSQNGTACVACTDPHNIGTIYAWQVVDGLDSECNEVRGKCASVRAVETIYITVDSLTPDTSYICYFTACNSYPTLSYCIDGSSSSSTTTNLPSVYITTAQSDDFSGSAMLDLLTALLLIFN